MVRNLSPNGIFGGLKGAGDILSRNARNIGHSPGLAFEDTVLTWSQVNERACRFANALLRQGIQKGDRVALYSRNCHQWVEAAFALAKIGAVMVTVNNRLTAGEVAYILNDANAVGLVTSQSELPVAQAAAEQVDSVRLMVVIDPVSVTLGEGAPLSYEAMLRDSSLHEPNLDTPLSYDDPLMLLYTSGTTGFPKGAVYTHGSMLIGTMYHVHAIGARSTNRVMLPSPLYSAAGVAGMYSHLYVGAYSVIVNFEPTLALKTIEQHRISFTNLVPTTIQRLVSRDDLSEFDLSSLKTILYGGAPIPLTVLRQAREKLPGVGFRQTFASTETGLKGTVLEPEEHDAALNNPTCEHLLLSCGRPQTNVEVAIWDEHGKDVGPGVLGEIAVRSEAGISGFWNNPGATTEAIHNGWILTGDIARRDEDGYFYLVDRKKDLIVTGAFNVYPSEVERVMQQHPAVYEVGVIGVPSEQWGEAIKACVVLREGAQVSAEELIAFCEGRIAGYKKPKSVDFFPALPRNPTGKLLYRQLRETYWKHSERKIG
ncbi:class I adenylate-forming enzyme family protein [Denitratisoma oestradiolicum]|uniref:Long-chain-fatty-acid--CoA ligase n=1 Tax=Denitratisoma oestradiolicum TaxID=311182 RepID=A0A6S6YAG8_9PROT|nr:AMP-binding protein [Denitratisoma oestradiolicum]TWO79144.1 hypothetical protein CBW56_16180 [Denitratisoma oestradiolicum]CAB1369602.1 conserved protein of unknown function [Denitratisoma oestradiolicum]